PRNPQTLYATSGGAVIESTDAGSTWAFLSQIAPGATATALAASGDILYAGTQAQGAFKSSDGGLTWTAINNGIPPAANGNIYQLWADPSPPRCSLRLPTPGLCAAPMAAPPGRRSRVRWSPSPP